MISFLVTLFCFFFAIQASPLSLPPRAALDVFAPPIHAPTADTVWVIGQTECVEWDASDAPQNISNRASVRLSDFSRPLAQDFDLRTGKVDVYIPYDVEPGLHFITLFGDSGDRSKTFRIVEASALPSLPGSKA